MAFGLLCEPEFDSEFVLDSGFERMVLTHYVGMHALVKPTTGKTDFSSTSINH